MINDRFRVDCANACRLPPDLVFAARPLRKSLGLTSGRHHLARPGVRASTTIFSIAKQLLFV
jgi:hypothetical protein